MMIKKLRNRLGGAATIGVASLAATMSFAGTASAYTAPAPPPPTYNVGPNFNNGNITTVRSAGSDTTFFLMQQIGDLYNQAGLYGCNLDATFAHCNTSNNVATTDTTDNYSKTEVSTGLDKLGSGDGQKQLCSMTPTVGGTTEPTPLPVDFARSSKPNGGYCSDEVQTGFAIDYVPAMSFPNVNPGTYGAITNTAAPFYAASQVAGPSTGEIGPVAKGWLPGDNVAGTYSGTAFTNVTGTGGAASIAYRLWCATDSTRITDWGQLTNLSATGVGNGGNAKTVGNGAAVGVPVNLWGINTGSGTEFTFITWAQSGQVSCPGNGNGNGDGGNQLLENNMSQLSIYLNGNYPGQLPEQATELATSLSYMSNGVYNSNVYAHNAVVGTDTYAATKVKENGLNPGVPTYPTRRTLYNIYRTGTLKGSTAGFVNWILDDNNVFQKGTDNSTGLNYDTEISGLINTTFGFQRIADDSGGGDLSGNSPNGLIPLADVAFPNS